MIRPKEILASSIKVTGFWSIVAGALYVNCFDARITLINLGVIALAIMVGIAASAYTVWQDRRSLEKSIEGQTVRGMHSSFASIPIHSPPLSHSAHVPPKEAYPAEIDDCIDVWRTKMDEPMKALLDIVLKTLWQHKATPAAPLMKKDKGIWVSNGNHNHGGRSLVAHSLLVANLMCEQAQYYKYEVPQHKGIPLFKMLDPEYCFDPEDPLIPIIGLAHDIGKIECMIWEDGHATKMEAGHDYKGAAIVSR